MKQYLGLKVFCGVCALSFALSLPALGDAAVVRRNISGSGAKQEGNEPSSIYRLSIPIGYDFPVETITGAWFDYYQTTYQGYSAARLYLVKRSLSGSLYVDQRDSNFVEGSRHIWLAAREIVKNPSQYDYLSAWLGDGVQNQNFYGVGVARNQ